MHPLRSYLDMTGVMAIYKVDFERACKIVKNTTKELS